MNVLSLMLIWILLFNEGHQRKMISATIHRISYLEYSLIPSIPGETLIFFVDISDEIGNYMNKPAYQIDHRIDINQFPGQTFKNVIVLNRKKFGKRETVFFTVRLDHYLYNGQNFTGTLEITLSINPRKVSNRLSLSLETRPNSLIFVSKSNDKAYYYGISCRKECTDDAPCARESGCIEGRTEIMMLASDSCIITRHKRKGCDCCKCKKWLKGDYCGYHEDVCKLGNCYVRDRCGIDSATGALKDCKCLWKDDKCRLYVDPCGQGTCLNGGSCSYINHTHHVCSCLEKWTGDRCEKRREPCEKFRCYNDAQCKNIDMDTPSCKCRSSWKGKTCQIPQMPCDTSPCKNGGTCKNLGFKKYECECPLEWTGKNCDIYFKCQDNQCFNLGTCFIGGKKDNWKYNCICPKGFQSKFCERDINECEEPVCKNYQKCRNTIGSYKCECKPPAYGDSCQYCPPKNIYGNLCEFTGASNFLVQVFGIIVVVGFIVAICICYNYKKLVRDSKVPVIEKTDETNEKVTTEDHTMNELFDLQVSKIKFVDTGSTTVTSK